MAPGTASGQSKDGAHPDLWAKRDAVLKRNARRRLRGKLTGATVFAAFTGAALLMLYRAFFYLIVVSNETGQSVHVDALGTSPTTLVRIPRHSGGLDIKAGEAATFRWPLDNESFCWLVVTPMDGSPSRLLRARHGHEEACVLAQPPGHEWPCCYRDLTDEPYVISDLSVLPPVPVELRAFLDTPTKP